MKFYRKMNNLGQFAYRVELHEYDAFPPVLELTLDHAPTNINRDREAVALTLLFSRWVSGEFDFVQEIGPNTINEIRAFCAPISVSAGPVEYHAKALPSGRGCGSVSNSHEVVIERGVVDLPSDKFNGAIRSHDVIQLATNSFLFKQHNDDPLPSLAIGVLFAEDLGIDSLSLPKALSTTDFHRCRALLSSVRLGLS